VGQRASIRSFIGSAGSPYSRAKSFASALKAYFSLYKTDEENSGLVQNFETIFGKAQRVNQMRKCEISGGKRPIATIT
jgi:hypothetical protein